MLDGRRGGGGYVGQLTMLAAGKRILPRLFKPGMSCCLISALCYRVLRSQRSASSTQRGYAFSSPLVPPPHLQTLIESQLTDLSCVLLSCINPSRLVLHVFVVATCTSRVSREAGVCVIAEVRGGDGREGTGNGWWWW